MFSVDCFGASEYFSGSKKRIILDEEKLWWGYVSFHCIQISLVMSMRFIFGDDWNDAVVDHVSPKTIYKDYSTVD